MTSTDSKATDFALLGGRLIDPAAKLDGQYDLLVQKGRVVKVAPQGQLGSLGADIKKIDAKGCWICPGFIDLHVHLREPGYEWKETVSSGVSAAVVGGYTSVCCMPNTCPVNDHEEVTKYVLRKADDANLSRVFPIGAISRKSEGKELAPYSELFKAGCVAFSDDGEPVFDAGLMRRAMEWVKMLGLCLTCHEEDKTLSARGDMNESGLSTKLGLRGFPGIAEIVMIARDLELVRLTGSPIHICHVSTIRSVELIRQAKAEGLPVTAEVTPHHLLLTEDLIKGYNTNGKMSPPLRSSKEVEVLRKALADGTIDAIASDHAPHEVDTKLVEFSQASFGVLGLQTSLPSTLGLVKEKLLSPLRAVEVMSTLPAKIFNLKSMGKSLGTLQVDSVADITLVDPNRKWVFDRAANKSMSFNSPFLGQTLEGAARAVWVAGVLKVDNFSLIENQNGTEGWKDYGNACNA